MTLLAGIAIYFALHVTGYRRTALATIIVVLLCIAATRTAQADCHAFYKRQVVYQQYVQPIVVPLVFYQAGDELRIQAAVKRELEYQQNLQAPSKGYQAPIQAPVQAPIQAPAGKVGTLEPLQQVSGGAFAKCARCHTGDKASGGFVLDGRTFIDSRSYFRWGEIAIAGRNVPQKMQAMIAALTPEEKGVINDALMNLVNLRDPEPAADRPPPAPVPAEDGLQ